MTDEMKNTVKALRICGSMGVDICDGKQPNAIDICRDCPFFEHLKAGKPRECFKAWVKAADELERLTKIAEESSMKAALCDEIMVTCARQQRELEAAERDMWVVCDIEAICDVCKHRCENNQCKQRSECKWCVNTICECCGCDIANLYTSKFKWRGLCVENGGAEDD